MSSSKKSLMTQEEHDLVDLIARAVNAWRRVSAPPVWNSDGGIRYVEFINLVDRAVHETDVEDFISMLEDSQNGDMRSPK